MSSIFRSFQIHICKIQNFSTTFYKENFLIVMAPEGVVQLTRQAQIIALRYTNICIAPCWDLGNLGEVK